MTTANLKKHTLKFFLAFIALWLLLYIGFGENGVIQILNLKNNLAITKSEIAKIEQDNDFLKQAIKDIKDNPDILEKQVRNMTGLVKNNEVIYYFPPFKTAQ